MSISENDKSLRNMIIYDCAALFCLIIFLVYDQFSHGVRSPYMTWLFAFPLVLGFIPELLMSIFPKIPRLSRLEGNLYHSGVTALTVSSLLRGIFDIAGTESDYQRYLMIAGTVMLISGVTVYFFRWLKS
ncbi:MAG: hypothetical protein LIO69_06045 [Oscillospiraceae bacterium]|nr:hypothetical protein [Oscillospiraceae bacterium]